MKNYTFSTMFFDVQPATDIATAAKTSPAGASSKEKPLASPADAKLPWLYDRSKEGRPYKIGELM